MQKIRIRPTEFEIYLFRQSNWKKFKKEAVKYFPKSNKQFWEDSKRLFPFFSLSTIKDKDYVFVMCIGDDDKLALIHEITHVVGHIIELCDFYDESGTNTEFRAYLTEDLFREATNESR